MKWPKIAGWTLAALATLIVIVGVGGYLFLKSNSFNQFALRKIAEATQQATGAPTTIGSLDFSLYTLTAHLYNITVLGTGNPGQPPLLQIDKLTVGLEVQSALHRKVSLSELIVEHPVAYVRVDEAGKSNLPAVPPPQSSSNTGVFDLGVRHAQLIRGEVTYNDKKIPLNADLYNLGSEIHFDRAATRYSGSISYDNGRLQYGDYTALPHSLQARIDATPAEFLIESALLKIGNLVASLRANLSNYANPTLTGDYDLRLDAHDLAWLAPAYRPSGSVSLVGRIHYRDSANQTVLRGLALGGQIASDGFSASTTIARVSVQKLRGSFQLANGVLQANRIEIDSLGGRINADLNVRNLDATPSGHLRAALHSISLQATQHAVRQEANQVAISGIVNGTADASWTGSLNSVRVRSDLMVSAAAKSASRVAS